MSDHNIWPLLTSRDALALRRWLGTLGFAEGVLVMGEDQDEELVQHSEMVWPEGGRVMVSTQRPEDPTVLPAGVGNVYIVTDDPEAVYRRATDAGATISRELLDTDYNSREFTVRSPEGHGLSFGTYAG